MCSLKSNKDAECDIADLHSHILPNADHGSQNLKTSISQLKLAQKYGVKRILATPHFYPNEHTLSSFLDLRDRAVAELIDAHKSDIPEIKVGAEVLICDGLQRFSDLDKLCFQNTKYIMLEIPFSEFSESYAITAGEIVDKGYKVILAHADRYPKEVIDVMIQHGVRGLQINSEVFTNPFRRTKHIFNWINEGFVCAIGSDIHKTSKNAYYSFSMVQKHLWDLMSIVKEASDRIWNEIESLDKK